MRARRAIGWSIAPSTAKANGCVCDAAAGSSRREGKAAAVRRFITNLGKKSKVDPLTGLFNKFEFEDDVRRRMETMQSARISLMVLGIDDLRHINDRYDRAFGDEVIRFVAQRIQARCPRTRACTVWTATSSRDRR